MMTAIKQAKYRSIKLKGAMGIGNHYLAPCNKVSDPAEIINVGLLGEK